MKKSILLFVFTCFSVIAFSQTYLDGVKAGIRDAETLKTQVLPLHPLAGISVYLQERYINPLAPNGLGAVVPAGTYAPPHQTVYVNVFVSDPTTANTVLWNDVNVVQRTQFLWSMYTVSEYWTGIYDGFLKRWFFGDFN